MDPVNAMSEIKPISKAFIAVSNASDYIPVVSTVTSLVEIFQKCVVIPLLGQSRVNNSHYYKHLKNKSIARCITLLVPVLGNIIIALLDIGDRKYSRKHLFLKVVAEQGNQLQYASDTLKNDRDVVKAAIKNDFSSFQYADPGLRKDKTFIEEIVRDDPATFKKFDNSIRGDKELITGLVESIPDLIKYASDDVRLEKEFNLKLIKDFPIVIKYLHEDLRNNFDFLIDTIRANHEVLLHQKFLGVGCWSQILGINIELVKYREEGSITNDELACYLLDDLDLYEKYVSPKLKNDPKFIYDVPEILSYADENLLSDKQFAKKMVQLNGLLLEHFSGDCKKDYEVILSACIQNKAASEFVHDSLKNNERLKEMIDGISSRMTSNLKEFVSAERLLQNLPRVIAVKKKACQRDIEGLFIRSTCSKEDIELYEQVGKLLIPADLDLNKARKILIAFLSLSDKSSDTEIYKAVRKKIFLKIHPDKAPEILKDLADQSFKKINGLLNIIKEEENI